MNASNFLKPVKVALRTKDKVAKSPDEGGSRLRTSTQGFILSTGGSLTSDLSQKARV
jgi:hypothetical protein